jgi:hypothetical protein
MYLLIYACCKESDRQHASEQSVRLEWAEQPPAIDDLVSMGRQKRWRLVELVAYKPVVLEAVMLEQDVRAVYLAQVQREDLPLAPRSEWSFSHPQENMHIHLTAIGEPALQLGFNVLGEPPCIDAPLLLAPSPAPTMLVNQWVIDRYDTYLPENNTSYHAIYLAWCLITEISVKSV